MYERKLHTQACAVGRSAAAVTREERLARLEVEKEGRQTVAAGVGPPWSQPKVKSQAGRSSRQSRWTDAICRAIRAGEEIPLGLGPAVPLWLKKGLCVRHRVTPWRRWLEREREGRQGDNLARRRVIFWSSLYSMAKQPVCGQTLLPSILCN